MSLGDLILLALLCLDPSHLFRGQRLEVRWVFAVSLQEWICQRLIRSRRESSSLPVCRLGTVHFPLFEVCSNRSDISSGREKVTNSRQFWDRTSTSWHLDETSPHNHFQAFYIGGLRWVVGTSELRSICDAIQQKQQQHKSLRRHI